MSALTTQEQAHIRAALRYLRTRSGNWKVLAQALHTPHQTLRNVISGQVPSATLAIRLARMVGVSIDNLLAGKYLPPGTCPHCGHRLPDGPTNEKLPADS